MLAKTLTKTGGHQQHVFSKLSATIILYCTSEDDGIRIY